MLNEIRLIGNLASDPETGKAKETAFTKFVVIGNGRTDTQKVVLPVTTFGKVAAYAAGLRKGHRVLVIGRLQTDQWQTQDGQPRSRTVAIAELVIPIESQKR